jgi:hypothetical protein
VERTCIVKPENLILLIVASGLGALVLMSFWRQVALMLAWLSLVVLLSGMCVVLEFAASVT